MANKSKSKKQNTLDDLENQVNEITSPVDHHQMYTPDANTRRMEPGAFKMLITPTPNAPSFEKREEDGYNVIGIKPRPTKENQTSKDVAKKKTINENIKQSNQSIFES